MNKVIKTDFILYVYALRNYIKRWGLKTRQKNHVLQSYDYFRKNNKSGLGQAALMRTYDLINLGETSLAKTTLAEAKKTWTRKDYIPNRMVDRPGQFIPGRRRHIAGLYYD